ncbi:hypothetical protein OY671_003993 [Metschnikowia pulcherrima]|nr:hypothetical protein OY671_003993 [Metschnikowia pulcherrima]
MNVNPHLQYLQSQQSQQPSGATSSPQMAQMQMQHQRQMQQQRQQILSQQLHQQQQQQQQSQQGQQGHVTQGNSLLAALNGGGNASNQGGGGSLGAQGALAANMGQNGQTSNGSGGGIAFGQMQNPSALLQMQQSLSQQRYGNPMAQQNPQNSQNAQNAQNVQNQQQLHMQQGPPMQMQQQQAPVIKEVWNYNLEFEFNALRTFINDKTQNVFISIHQEIPGIVARPVGTFKSSTDYHFQTLRSNADLLSLIQLSFCAVKVRNNEISNSVIWQFNFHYDLAKEMFNEEHLAMLASTSQINFASHMSQGIAHLTFAELMMESGLLLDQSINWLSYHSGYDLGFLVSLLTNNILPSDESEFFWWCAKYFPNFYDLKHVGNQLLSSSGKAGADHSLNSPKTPAADMGKGILANNKPSIEYLAEELHLLPISPVVRQYFTSQGMGQYAGHQNQQMTSTLHAYLLMECFKELLRQANSDLTVFEKYKGYLWGLGDVLEGAKQVEATMP